MLDAGMLWQVQHVDSRGRNGLHYLVRFHGLKTDVIQIACSGAAGAAAARMGYASDGPTNNELFARPSTHRLLALHILCRNFPRQHLAIEAVAAAFTGAAQVRDHTGHPTPF